MENFPFIATVIPHNSMDTFNELLQDLSSSNAAIRDIAALGLMEIGNDEAVPYLLNAIRSQETENHRGTLVFSLSAFDCRKYLLDLVDFCLTGTFEVSSNAYNIINDFDITEHLVQQIREQLKKHQIDNLPNKHNLEAFNALSKIEV